MEAKFEYFNEDPFLPLDALNALINPTSVKELLESEGFSPGDITKTVQGIFGKPTSFKGQNPQQKPNLLRIFTILVMSEHLKPIEKFIKNGINDSALPLMLRNGPSQPSVSDSSAGTVDIDDAKLQDCLVEFTRNHRTLFRAYQKIVHVPFFRFPGQDLNVSFYDLDEDCVLPFTEVGEAKKGGYGSVRKIRIHPAHHNIENAPSNLVFAVKTLRFHFQSEQMFRKEVEAFEKLAHKKKPCFPDHLMHLELVYRHRGNCCFIFPWANGNLDEYWQSHQRRPDDKKDVQWFFKQCLGITLGLSRLHNPNSFARANTTKDDPVNIEETAEANYGRHGDIKPENILWFDRHEGDSDHLVISDFGLTEFKSFTSKSHVTPSKIQGYSGTYKPPDLNFDKVNQRYDIWSLGCVFLELASWLLLGGDAVTTLREQRLMRDPRFQSDLADDKFFYLKTMEDSKMLPMVKPCVVDWIQSLHALDTCPKSVHDFLEIIQEKMLQPKATERSRSNEIRRDLQTIYHRCKRDELYATKGEAIIVPGRPAAPTRQQLPQTYDSSQQVIYPKLTEDMRHDASQGRQQGSQAKLNDVDCEPTPLMDLGLGGEASPAEPAHPISQKLQRLEAIINVNTTTQQKQRSSSRVDELPTTHVAIAAASHDEIMDEYREESLVGNVGSTGNSEGMEIGTGTPVSLPNEEIVPRGTKRKQGESYPNAKKVRRT
ncbi:hypothetical protein CEP53_003896 [Fusarium sp. AF-6]|nr:hypothetical protein CEP53_003896 [Fusarium sp. AF-6]